MALRVPSFLPSSLRLEVIPGPTGSQLLEDQTLALVLPTLAQRAVSGACDLGELMGRDCFRERGRHPRGRTTPAWGHGSLCALYVEPLPRLEPEEMNRKSLSHCCCCPNRAERTLRPFHRADLKFRQHPGSHGTAARCRQKLRQMRGERGQAGHLATLPGQVVLESAVGIKFLRTEVSNGSEPLWLDGAARTGAKALSVSWPLMATSAPRFGALGGESSSQLPAWPAGLSSFTCNMGALD